LRNSGDGQPNVEVALQKLMAYLDRTFGVINMYTDPRVGYWIADHFSLETDDTDDAASTIGSIYQPSLHRTDRVAAAPPPNHLILYIWTEFITAINDMADAVDTMATNKQGMKTLLDKLGGQIFGVEVKDNMQEVEGRRRRFASCYLTGVEYVKALLYGDVEGVHYGFDVPSLENEQYTSLISMLKAISEGRGKALAKRTDSWKNEPARPPRHNIGAGTELLY